MDISGRHAINGKINRKGQFTGPQFTPYIVLRSGVFGVITVHASALRSVRPHISGSTGCLHLVLWSMLHFFFTEYVRSTNRHH